MTSVSGGFLFPYLATKTSNILLEKNVASLPGSFPLQTASPARSGPRLPPARLRAATLQKPCGSATCCAGPLTLPPASWGHRLAAGRPRVSEGTSIGRRPRGVQPAEVGGGGAVWEQRHQQTVLGVPARPPRRHRLRPLPAGGGACPKPSSRRAAIPGREGPRTRGRRALVHVCVCVRGWACVSGARVRVHTRQVCKRECVRL